MQPSRSIELIIIYFEQLNRIIKYEWTLSLSKLRPGHSIFFSIEKQSVPQKPKLAVLFEAALPQQENDLVDVHHYQRQF